MRLLFGEKKKWGGYLLSLGLVDLLLKLLDLLVDKVLELSKEVVDGLLLVVIETEPDEAEEDGTIEHAAHAEVASKVDDEEEAKEHAQREHDVPDKDGIDGDGDEDLDERLDKIEEAVDVLGGDLEVLIGKVGLGVLVTLEVGNDAHDIEAKASDGGEESDPAEEAKNSELVADEDKEENVDGAEDSKRRHEVLPHEDLLHLTKELALLEGLADHLARALTRARRGSLGRLLLLLLLLNGLLGCRLFLLLLFLNGCGCRLTFLRHDYLM